MMAHIGRTSTPDKIIKNSSVDRNITSHTADYKARNLYSQISQESLRNQHHPDEDFCFFNTDKASAQHVNMYNLHAVQHH